MFHTPDALNQLATTYLESLQHIKIDQLKITDKQGNQYLPDTVKNLYLKYKLISLKFDIIPKMIYQKFKTENTYTKLYLLINQEKYTLTWTKQPLAITTLLTSVIIWNLSYRLNTV